MPIAVCRVRPPRPAPRPHGASSTRPGGSIEYSPRKIKYGRGGWAIREKACQPRTNLLRRRHRVPRRNSSRSTSSARGSEGRQRAAQGCQEPDPAPRLCSAPARSSPEQCVRRNLTVSRPAPPRPALPREPGPRCQRMAAPDLDPGSEKICAERPAAPSEGPAGGSALESRKLLMSTLSYLIRRRGRGPAARGREGVAEHGVGKKGKLPA